MPSVSKKQHNLMALVANNPKAAKRLGIPQSVGEEFMKADKGKKFGKGGEMKKKVRKFQDGGETSGVPNYLAGLEKYSRRPSKLDELRSDIKATGRAGMAAAKEAVGAVPQIRGAKELASRVRIPKSYDEEMGMKKGGKVHSDVAKDKPMMKKVAKAEVKAHEKKMHKMAGGGKVGQLSKADGCATKGKSKGKMVKMAYGGKC
jgi:hypothetical protein